MDLKRSIVGILLGVLILNVFAVIKKANNPIKGERCALFFCLKGGNIRRFAAAVSCAYFISVLLGAIAIVLQRRGQNAAAWIAFAAMVVWSLFALYIWLSVAFWRRESKELESLRQLKK